MAAPHRIRGRAARIVLLTVVVLGAVAVLAAPAVAQRHSVHRTDGDTSSSMSWSGQSIAPFRSPTSAPGLRMPSIDGKLVACRTGRASAAAGFDILYKTLGGARGTWGGPGDQTQPAVSAGLIAGMDRGAVAVFDPATHTATTVSDTAAVPSSPAFAAGVVVWQDHRGADWDIYARRVDPLTGAPSGDVFVVCTAGGDQTDPAVDGSTVVWQDHRGAGWDVYALDLATTQESPVCAAGGDQMHPDVSGDLVVWQDDRRGQWNIWSRDLTKRTTALLYRERAAQTYPAASTDLVVWQERMKRSFILGNDPRVHRSRTPLIQAYSRAAGQVLGQVMAPQLAAAQTRPAVSGSLAVWQDTSSTRRNTNLPAGVKRIYGGTVEDLWAWGYSTTPQGPYVNSPEVTFRMHVDVCPHPPVAQMSLIVGARRPWNIKPVWQPFAPVTVVHLPDADGRSVYALSFKDSAGEDSGGEGSEFILDTHGPTCWAPYPVTALAGGTATLRYKVTDALSNGAQATVTVLRKDGTVALALPARYVVTGRLVKRSFTCGLPAGAYRLRVTATDLAGNAQVRAGKTTLRVK